VEDPHPIQFLIQIAGAAALLIWAVRLVRTGVAGERELFLN